MNPERRTLEPLLIHHFLENSARNYPDKTALIHEDIRATYSEINNTANSIAGWLSDQGIKNGDRVALLFENSLEYVVAYYGILKSGAVAVPLSTDLKPDSLNHLIAELEPYAIITNYRFERLLKAGDQALIKKIKLVIKNPRLTWPGNEYDIISYDEVVFNPHIRHPASGTRHPEDLASIIYTSGSTGKPKGVMLSHKNITANTHSICQYLNLSSSEIQMVVLPFFYVMGKSLLNTHFAVGGTVVINNKFAYPATVISQMIHEKVTGFSGVPSTYAYLLHRSPLEKHRDDLSSLRYCSQAGGHMSGQIKTDLRKVLPEHTRVFIMYGATEASARLTYLDPLFYEPKLNSIGREIPGVVLKVLDNDGNELGDGKEGQLVGYGDNIMQGYWRDEASTKQVLIDNGYHTGDMGYRDSEGFYYITGRKDNLLKVGGHRINTQEVEDVLMNTGLLIEVSVLGQKDKLLGNKMISLLVAKNDDLDVNLVLKSISEKLPSYKIPQKFKVVRSIPKNSAGKTDRVKCMEMIS